MTTFHEAVSKRLTELRDKPTGDDAWEFLAERLGVSVATIHDEITNLAEGMADAQVTVHRGVRLAYVLGIISAELAREYKPEPPYDREPLDGPSTTPQRETTVEIRVVPVTGDELRAELRRLGILPDDDPLADADIPQAG